VGNFCTHFGAPLTTGVLFDDKIICPWHSAGFSVVDGTCENSPAMDNLPRFEVI
jgi:nitrite reductase/ring-hydroxylating ferredoxin subunit